MNFAAAAKAYSRVGLETAVGSADPLGLVLMLYDGAILSVNKAVAALNDRNIRVKGESISRAIQIIEEGLRAALDRDAGGAIARQLDDLYLYMGQKLLLAGAKNDASGMNEVVGLLSDLRGAWATLAGQSAPSPAAVPAAARVATVAGIAATQPRGGIATAPAPAAPNPATARQMRRAYT